MDSLRPIPIGFKTFENANQADTASGKGWLAPRIVSALTAGFGFELNGADGHAFVDRFAHVVEGQGGGADGCESFHLHSGAGLSFDGGLDEQRFRRRLLEFNVYPLNWQGVAQGDPFSGALGCGDTSQACGVEGITFGCLAGHDGLEHFGRGGELGGSK